MNTSGAGNPSLFLHYQQPRINDVTTSHAALIALTPGRKSVDEKGPAKAHDQTLSVVIPANSGPRPTTMISVTPA